MDSMVPQIARLRAVARETHDTFTWSLEPPDGNGFSFRAGQFNMLYVFGAGEAPISFSGKPENEHELVHTIRAVGSVTKLMTKLQPGDAVGVRGPFGSSWPLDDAIGKDIVMVTGGIGLAPIRPVIYSVLQNREAYGRVTLLHGARTPTELLYVEELSRWQSDGALQAYITVDIGNSNWTGPVGLVTELFQRFDLDASKTIGMICGPEIMMRFVIREFEKRDVRQDQLYISMERNMHCAIGFCGHCQFGPSFVCMDGPVFRYDKIRSFFQLGEA